jgi:RNA polymerase sigma-70 factor (ECF subfamily)
MDEMSQRPVLQAVAPRREGDDAALVEQARRGDERAFAALYRRHVRYCAGVVYRIMGPSPSAEGDVDDVLQEAFVDAALALDSLQEPAHFRAWLVRIVVHRLHKRMAKKRRFRFLTRAIELVSPQASDPNDRRKVDDLYEALDAISPDLRVPWVLHHVEGETLPEVAKMCDVSLATVKRRIADAETKLNRRLHGQ